jgi:hypothetical protein
MTDKKTLKRSVKAVWEKVKAARADRAKLYSPTEIAISADQLVQLADELRDLAKQLSALNAMPPGAIPAAGGKPRGARKRKTKVGQ